MAIEHAPAGLRQGEFDVAGRIARALDFDVQNVAATFLVLLNRLQNAIPVVQSNKQRPALPRPVPAVQVDTDVQQPAFFEACLQRMSWVCAGRGSADLKKLGGIGVAKET